VAGAGFIFDAKTQRPCAGFLPFPPFFFLPLAAQAQEARTAPVNAFLTTTIVALGLPTLVLMTLAPDGTETTTGPTETAHDFHGFNRIDVHGGVRLLVTQGPEFRVVARGSQAGLARLDVDQTSDTLRARHRFGFWWGPRNVTLTVTLPELRELEASGACMVHVSGIDHPRSLSLEALGATVIKFSGRVERLRAEATGASRIQAEGTCQHLDAEAVGLPTSWPSGCTPRPPAWRPSGPATPRYSSPANSTPRPSGAATSATGATRPSGSIRWGPVPSPALNFSP